MRGRAAVRDRQALDERAVQRRRVAGRDVARDDDAGLGQVARGGLAGQVAQHSAGHVVDVGRALAQVRVVQPAVGRGHRFRGSAPRRRSAAAAVDRLARRADQRGVVEQHQVRVEDRGLGLPRLRGDPRPRVLHVRTRGGACGVEPRPLGSAGSPAGASSAGAGVAADGKPGRADGDARRGRHALHDRPLSERGAAAAQGRGWRRPQGRRRRPPEWPGPARSRRRSCRPRARAGRRARRPPAGRWRGRGSCAPGSRRA